MTDEEFLAHFREQAQDIRTLLESIGTDTNLHVWRATYLINGEVVRAQLAHFVQPERGTILHAEVTIGFIAGAPSNLYIEGPTLEAEDMACFLRVAQADGRVEWHREANTGRYKLPANFEVVRHGLDGQLH